MNNGLLIILSIIGALALYWVLFGQWKYNKMMKQSQEKDKTQESKQKDSK
jgi:hypothetical protein